MNNRTTKGKEMALTALEKSLGNISQAVKAAGVARTTFYNWINEDTEFAKAVEDINESCIDLAEGLLKKKMTEGDLGAIIFFLKTQGKKRGYTERTQVEHSGKDGEPLAPTVIKVEYRKPDGDATSET